MPAAVNNNFQEYDPRHRLTGAVVLILLAIILLPMLLSKSPEEKTAEAEQVVMEVTKEGNKVFVSRITTVSTESEAQSNESASSKTKESVNDDSSDEASSALFKPMSHTTAAKSTAVKSKSSTASSKPSVKKTASKSAASKPATTTKPSTVKASSSWILQVGVFSQSANASKKVSELKKKGFNAKSVKIKTSKGVVTRVWMGPFTDRASAVKMQDRLQHKTRQRGMVVKK